MGSSKYPESDRLRRHQYWYWHAYDGSYRTPYSQGPVLKIWDRSVKITAAFILIMIYCIFYVCSLVFKRMMERRQKIQIEDFMKRNRTIRKETEWEIERLTNR